MRGKSRGPTASDGRATRTFQVLVIRLPIELAIPNPIASDSAGIQGGRPATSGSACDGQGRSTR